MPLLLLVHTVTYVVTMCTRNAIAIACSYSYIHSHYVYVSHTSVGIGRNTKIVK